MIFGGHAGPPKPERPQRGGVLRPSVPSHGLARGLESRSNGRSITEVVLIHFTISSVGLLNFRAENRLSSGCAGSRRHTPNCQPRPLQWAGFLLLSPGPGAIALPRADQQKSMPGEP